jgi:hypothetical protein
MSHYKRRGRVGHMLNDSTLSEAPKQLYKQDQSIMRLSLRLLQTICWEFRLPCFDGSQEARSSRSLVPKPQGNTPTKSQSEATEESVEKRHLEVCNSSQSWGYGRTRDEESRWDGRY